MPYEIETKDGIVLRNIPDNIAPDAPEIKQRVAAAREQATPQGRQKAAVEAARAQYDPTKGMSVWERGAANVGAGMDNLIHGVRQRYNEITGDEETAAALRAETAEKRKRDEHLADSMTGGKVLQFAGEAIPTLVIPGGSTIKGAMAAGALGGALQPTAEGESAALNAGVGAAFGGALSGAMKGAGKAYRAIRPGNAETRAAQQIAAELGPDAGQRAAALRQTLRGATGGPAAPPASGGGSWLRNMARRGGGAQPNPTPGPGGIPLSAAAHAQDDALAVLEQASRLRNKEAWAAFDREQATALANRLRGATGEADEIANRVAQRGANYRNARAAAVGAMDEGRFASELPGFQQHLDDLLRSPDAVDSGVRSALNESRGIAGADYVSPEHLMELRKNLSGRLVPGNVLKSADRSNPAIQRLTGQIDNLLDNLSDDAWRPVNEGFRRDSAGVESARAAQRVRDMFYDPVSGLARKTSRTAGGDIPEITEKGITDALGQGWDKARRADLFSAETRQGLQEVQDAVRRQNIIQRLKKSGSAGGGSDTAGNFTALAQEEARQGILNSLGNVTGVGPMLRVGAETLGAVRNARTDAALANALQNPQAMQQLLAQVERMQGPQAAVNLARMLREAAAKTRNVAPGLTMDIRANNVSEE